MFQFRLNFFLYRFQTMMAFIALRGGEPSQENTQTKRVDAPVVFEHIISVFEQCKTMPPNITFLTLLLAIRITLDSIS
jgi:hypothetical protein